MVMLERRISLLLLLGVVITAMRIPVRDKRDATGTHIGMTVGAQVALVLTVADIMLSIVIRVLIIMVKIKENTTAMENANGIVLF